jgi:RNA polymerase-binding transcription factor DksA
MDTIAETASTLSPEFLAIQARLAQERSTVLARIDAVSRHDVIIDSDGVPAGDFESENALASMLDSRLAEIERALVRLADGSYGNCETCSQAIPPRRLEALPFATLCVPCQSAADKRIKIGSVRPVRF